MKLFEERTYRSQFNTERFTGFEVKHLETDLWIGIDPASYKEEMQEVALAKMKTLRQTFDDYIEKEPFFKKSLKPFQTVRFCPRRSKRNGGCRRESRNWSDVGSGRFVCPRNWRRNL